LELTNGCVCCSIGNDLGGAFAAVAATTPRPDYIVLEASGVADPYRVANYTYGQPGLELDGIIVLADSQTVENRSSDRFVGSTVRRQLASADILVLTKSGLVTCAQIRRTETWLQQKFPGVPLLRNDDCRFAWNALLGIGKPLKGFDAGHMAQEPHNQIFATATWQENALLDRDRLTEGLRSFGKALLRCKGWVRFADDPPTPVLVQLVGDRLEFTDVTSPDMEIQQALSFIFLRDHVAGRKLCEMVSACKLTGA
jgi:G3E family GTPase